MPFIIGTAGHIDHGKTSLIKALTGEDTDRLKEEKERGISIDLGFAHLDLPDGTQAGIVDVPGHERFIRNMLAGAHGIDLVLFTVAADDGVMPQTEEHLDIVHLLGVKQAIFVITKADLVPTGRIREVEEEINILTFGTALENSPTLPFSAVTGQGLAQLREEIVRRLQQVGRGAPKGYFRLPVDRAFILQGHGVVVTGTAQSGEVRSGDHVRALPGSQTFRVRSLQVHNRSVDSAGWGQRVALNLAGLEKAAIERGHVICDEKLTLTTDRFDARLEVRPAATKGVKNHQRVRIHLGTAERLGKLIILGGGEKIEPKEVAFCQITLGEPLLALRGDRFIVRDETARRTLGGGIVIHPWPQKHKRGETDLKVRLEALVSEDVPSLIERFMEESEDFAPPLSALYQFLNIREEELRDWIRRSPNLISISAEGEKLYTTKEKWGRLKDSVAAALRDYHAAHPLAPGMDMEEVRAKLPYAITPRLFRVVVELLEAEKSFKREGNLLSLHSHRVRLGANEQSLTENIRRLLGATPLAPPDLRQVEKELGADRGKVGEIVRVMEREKSIVRVAADLYYLADSVDNVRTVLYKYLSENGEITAASFRDLLGSSRKYTIALLEYFDREGTTVRVGDSRRLKSPPPTARPGAAR
ncbi:MAG TPA: selenocysteine-specific translation elongation factor [Verrucomicrobiae bacterium]|jgi:selenocysteine-specific elongation factor|nr:selenocysteine-specific translation elongation factor [Verrucomicrobiae bacterium]